MPSLFRPPEHMKLVTTSVWTASHRTSKSWTHSEGTSMSAQVYLCEVAEVLAVLDTKSFWDTTHLASYATLGPSASHISGSSESCAPIGRSVGHRILQQSQHGVWSQTLATALSPSWWLPTLSELWIYPFCPGLPPVSTPLWHQLTYCCLSGRAECTLH